MCSTVTLATQLCAQQQLAKSRHIFQYSQCTEQQLLPQQWGPHDETLHILALQLILVSCCSMFSVLPPLHPFPLHVCHGPNTARSGLDAQMCGSFAAILASLDVWTAIHAVAIAATYCARCLLPVIFLAHCPTPPTACSRWLSSRPLLGVSNNNSNPQHQQVRCPQTMQCVCGQVG